ncbi:PIR protein [Plasmodium ovale]|uniref:PIR protein n=1 Tax=Plasmodium ovale TaxID=36330 RepID=A0A1C3KKY4_PLAOA|nr:PIR protein [Plasmodium ovale]
MTDNKLSCIYKNANYEFFNDLDKYTQCASENEGSRYRDDYSSTCKFDEENYPEFSQSLNVVCKKLKFLLNLFFNNPKENTYNVNYIRTFLNYWLNDQLIKINKNTLCVSVFYQNMIIQDTRNQELRNLSGHIYDIYLDELKNMYLLHSLHKNYEMINRIINNEHENKKVCIHLAEECASDYKKAEETYSNKNTNFYEAFKSFKSKYEKLNFCTESLNGSEKIEFRTLSDSYQILENDCEISLYTKNSEQPEEVRKPPDTVTDTPSMNKQNIVIPVVSVFGISVIGFFLYKVNRKSL